MVIPKSDANMDSLNWGSRHMYLLVGRHIVIYLLQDSNTFYSYGNRKFDRHHWECFDRLDIPMLITGWRLVLVPLPASPMIVRILHMHNVVWLRGSLLAALLKSPRMASIYCKLDSQSKKTRSSLLFLVRSRLFAPNVFDIVDKDNPRRLQLLRP
jgi:hypothetical protein